VRNKKLIAAGRVRAAVEVDADTPTQRRKFNSNAPLIPL
jgi:hypothetical protein